MTRHLSLLLAAGLVIMVTACGDDDGADDTGGSIVGSWTVDTLGGVDVIAGSAVTLTITADGSLSGNTGCNSVNGQVTVDGNAVALDGPVASTMAACPGEAASEQERAYLGALEAMRTFTVGGDELILSDGDGEPVLTATAAAGIDEGAWSATRVNNGRGGSQSLIAGTEITAEFDPDGTVSGSSGCNTYSGPYEIDGDEMTIGPLAATEIGCLSPEGIMEQEQQYFAALGRVATWSSDGIALELRDAEGASQAAFVRTG